MCFAGLEARGKPLKSQDSFDQPLRRISSSDGREHRLEAKIPGVQPLNIHLPTPSPSTGSQSPSNESCHLHSSSYSVDPRLKSVSNTANTISLKQETEPSLHSQRTLTSTTVFMSPRSTSSNASTFEPISPPPTVLFSKQPPPLPPATTPPPPPVEIKEPPPPPPEVKSSPPEPSYGNYEDISPVFSPKDEESNYRESKIKKPEMENNKFKRKGSTDEAKISKFIESYRKESSSRSPSRRSPSSDRSRSPRSERSDRIDDYKRYEKRHDYRSDRKDRDKFYDKDRYDRDKHCDRDRKHDHHYDHRTSDKHRDYRSDSRSSYDRRENYRNYDRRRDEHDRNRSESRSSYLYRDDTRSWREQEKCSPHRTEEKIKTDSYPREHRHKEKDGFVEKKVVTDVDLPELTKEKASLPEAKQNDIKPISLGEKEKIEWSNLNQNILPISCENVVTVTVGQATNASENSHTSSVSQVVNASEIISTVVSSTPAAKELHRYDEDAYTFGIENCSDEEPLPPGDEKDVAQEVTLDRTRSKIKAAQDAMKKRKLSETMEDKQELCVKSRKIQIVLKGVQLKSCKDDKIPSPATPEQPSYEASVSDRGHWRSYSPLVSPDSVTETKPKDLTIVDVKEEVIVSDVEGSTLSNQKKDLPQVEDISPCDSPVEEPSVQVTPYAEEPNIETKAMHEPASNIYSDIEVNDDDDAMSLSSISSNEESFEVNEPVKKLSPRHKPITVPPPNMVFHPFLPPISVPPPGFFPTNVPPPPLAPVNVPPPPLPPPVVDVTVPPPSLPTTVPPPPLPPTHVPPPSLPTASGFYDNRTVPPYTGAFQKYPTQIGQLSGGFLPSDYHTNQAPPRKSWKALVIDEVFGTIAQELENVLKRDVSRKLVESSAFKSLDAWWDNQSKPKVSVFNADQVAE